MATLKVEAGFGSTMFTASPSWTDLTDRVRVPLSSFRGRPAVDGRFNAGTGSAIFDNRDGALTAGNTESPYYPNVVSGIPLRVSVVDGMTTYPVCYVSARGWQVNHPRSRNVTVSVPFADGFYTLSLEDLTGRSYPRQSTTDRLDAVLDDVGWPSALRDFDSSIGTVQAKQFAFPHDGGEQSALAHLQDVAEAEAGVLFMSADGKVTFRNRVAASEASPTVTFSDAAENIYDQLDMIDDDSFYWNVVQVARKRGVQVTVDSSGSAPKRTLTRDVMPMSSDSEARNLAEWLADVFGVQRRRIETLKTKPLKPGLISLYGSELRDVVHVDHQPDAGDPVDVDCAVEGIRDEFYRYDWIRSFALTPLSDIEQGPFFQLDVSALDGSDALA